MQPENQAPQAPVSAPDPWDVTRRLTIATMSLLLAILIIHVLYQGKPILQPLFIAVFIGYLLLPMYHWLGKYGLSGILASVVIMAAIIGALFGLGAMVFNSVEQVAQKLPDYEKKLDDIINDVVENYTGDPKNRNFRIRELPYFKEKGVAERTRAAFQAAAGTVLDFFTWGFITFLYLLFLIAEKFTLPRRLALAFGQEKGERVMEIVGTINLAIAEYIAVKTFISILAGTLSLVVLWYFNVDFFIMWSILIFVLNYIPYLGSWVAVGFPIALSFLQLGVAGGIWVAALLIAIQVGLGNFLEPMLAGKKLGVSPLLILLSLSFWGLLWGILGMILAVPLLVVVKIVLDNIEDTKPLATLMSNL
jgi:predicted PurR-regulated permease PerM